MSVRFDRSRWPIVVAELEGKATDADIDEYLRGLAALLQEVEPGVLVVDMTRAEPVPPEQRRRVGEWMRARRDELATGGLGAAFVISSGLLRFVLSSVFLIQRPPMPYTVVATRDEALGWARTRIEAARGRLPRR